MIPQNTLIFNLYSSFFNHYLGIISTCILYFIILMTCPYKKQNINSVFFQQNKNKIYTYLSRLNIVFDRTRICFQNYEYLRLKKLIIVLKLSKTHRVYVLFSV